MSFVSYMGKRHTLENIGTLLICICHYTAILFTEQIFQKNACCWMELELLCRCLCQVKLLLHVFNKARAAYRENTPCPAYTTKHTIFHFPVFLLQPKYHRHRPFKLFQVSSIAYRTLPYNSVSVCKTKQQTRRREMHCTKNIFQLTLSSVLIYFQFLL